MKLQQVRHFVALANSGSFTRAAEQCRLTQPALSRSIAQLETELGMQLVDRIGRHAELTPFGLTILEYANVLLFDVDELARVAKQQREGSAGRIRIGLGSTPSSLLTAPLIRRFSKARPYPHVTFTRGSIEAQLQALKERTLDVIIVEVTAVAATPDLHIEGLPLLRTGFLARKDHPLTTKSTVAFADMKAWPLATTFWSEAQVRVFTSIYGSHSHHCESVTINSDGIEVLLETAETTNLIYYGVLAPAATALEEGSLIELPISLKPAPAQFSIIRLDGRSVAPMFPVVREIAFDIMAKWSAV